MNQIAVTRKEHKCKIPECAGICCSTCDRNSHVQYEIKIDNLSKTLCSYCTKYLVAAIDLELQ